MTNPYEEAFNAKRAQEAYDAAYAAGRASRDSEVEALKADLVTHRELMVRHIAGNQALRDEVEALRADAERYRFCIDNNMVLSGGVVSFGWPIAPVGAQWNKYIDAAMRKEK